jgi:hypothetical protein
MTHPTADPLGAVAPTPLHPPADTRWNEHEATCEHEHEPTRPDLHGHHDHNEGHSRRRHDK